MKKCLRCGALFTPSPGFVNFCSIKCSHFRYLSKESRDNISRSLAEYHKEHPRSREIIDVAIAKQKETWRRKLLEIPIENLKFDTLRRRIIIEQDGKCNHCGLSIWMGHEIILEIDHIDGDNTNNKRLNLEAICPNCHSLTSTWRGRNKKNINKGRISDEDLMAAIIKHNLNFRQALIEVGLSPRGGNYVRCHRLARLLTSI